MMLTMMTMTTVKMMTMMMMISNININSQSGAKCALININLVVISWKLSLHCVGVRWREPFDSRNSNIVGIVIIIIFTVIVVVIIIVVVIFIYHISLTTGAIKISMKLKYKEFLNAFQFCQKYFSAYCIVFIWKPKHLVNMFVKSLSSISLALALLNKFQYFQKTFLHTIYQVFPWLQVQS